MVEKTHERGSFLEHSEVMHKKYQLLDEFLEAHQIK